MRRLGPSGVTFCWWAGLLWRSTLPSSRGTNPCAHRSAQVPFFLPHTRSFKLSCPVTSSTAGRLCVFLLYQRLSTPSSPDPRPTCPKLEVRDFPLLPPNARRAASPPASTTPAPRLARTMPTGPLRAVPAVMTECPAAMAKSHPADGRVGGGYRGGPVEARAAGQILAGDHDARCRRTVVSSTVSRQAEAVRRRWQ